MDIEPCLKFDGYSIKGFMIFEWPVTLGYFIPRIKTKEDDLTIKLAFTKKSFEPESDVVCVNAFEKLLPLS